MYTQRCKNSNLLFFPTKYKADVKTNWFLKFENRATTTDYM